MKKFLVAALALALVAGAPLAAKAALFFNDTQLGPTAFSSFDFNPGNALAKGSVPLSLDPLAPTTFELYYQASLGNFLNSDGNVIAGTGLGVDYEITIQAGVLERGFLTSVGQLNFAAFDFVDGPLNFVNIFYDTNMNSNALSGLGYGDGDLVMSGVFTGGTGSFSVNLAQGIAPLDGFGPNDYPGIFTLLGQGGTKLEASINQSDINQDFDFFQVNAPFNFLLNLAFNTSTITPFQQTNPSAQIVGQVPVFGTNGANIVNGLPGLNGPVDFLFQADANASVTVVPEPSTMLLTGLGLLGLGAVGYRRRKK